MQAGSSMTLTVQTIFLDSCCAKEAIVVKPSCYMADEKNVTTKTGAQKTVVLKVLMNSQSIRESL